MADSVVSVIGWNSLAIWSGSGFVVGDGTWVVTCFHVAARKLAGDRPLVPPRLIVVSPWTGEQVEARVVRTDADADLALLRIDDPERRSGAAPLPPLALAPEDALDPDVLGDHPPGRVRLSGFPHLESAADPAFPLRVVSAETEVVAVVEREQLPRLVLAPNPGPQKGWSGGPVTWSDSGEVIGVFFALVSRDSAPDRWFPHATPIRPLTALLRAAGLDPELLHHPKAEPAPRSADADARFQHRMHAIIAAMDDRWDRMEPEARALLKLTPEAAAAHSLMALALAGRGRHEAALEEWEAALRRSPERASLHAGRAEALLSLGRTEAAIAALRRAAALAPDDPDMPLRLAGALQRAGRWEEAHRELERSLSLSPNHPLARWELGLSYSRRGNRSAALKEMAQAVELTADLSVSDDFRPRYAAELERAGRTEEAERQLRELLRHEPGAPDALLALATHLMRHDKPNQVRTLAEQALAHHPGPEAEKAARRLLDQLEQQGREGSRE